MLKKRFCERPFDFFELGLASKTGVRSHVCCPAWLPADVGDISKEPFEKIWNGKKLQKIRKSILDGSYRYCVKTLCPKINNGTLHKIEEIKNPDWLDIINNKKVVLDRGPKIINLSNDKSCNLSCPSCRTEGIIVASGPQFEKMLQWHETLFKQVLSQAELLIFCSAGDPFASKVYRKFLFDLDGKDYPNLKIQIVSNGQLLNELAWQSMKRIHDSIQGIYISVDAATPEVYEKVRRGGKLSALMKNLKFLSQLRQQGYLKYLQLDFVVQQMNFRDMREFVWLGKELEVDRVFFQRIVDWKTYSPKEFLKQDVANKKHPEHKEFLAHLDDYLFDDEIVDMGNCSPFRKSQI